MKKQEKTKGIRSRWFRIYRNLAKIAIKEPRFLYFDGGMPDEPVLILSNHVGAAGPLSWELFYPRRFRFWGTHEMTEGLFSVYRYLTGIYYTKKKHWKKVPAYLFSLIAAPFATLFYKGLQLIPTYRDARFVKTIRESDETLRAGTDLIIFPEDSSSGYHDDLKAIFTGFATLARHMLRTGVDLPIRLAYYIKKERVFVLDRIIRFSALLSEEENDLERIALRLCDRMNELAKTALPLIPDPISV